METGIRIIPFNHVMRSARKRAGWTQKELAEKVGIATSTISAIERWYIASKWVMEDIACILGISVSDLIPEGVSKEELRKLESIELIVEVDRLDMVGAGEAVAYIEDIDDQIDLPGLEEAINSQLDTLSQREREILIYRYGLRGRQIHTLRDIADKYGVTTERIRQVEHGALKKMRHPERARELLPFINS